MKKTTILNEYNDNYLQNHFRTKLFSERIVAHHNKKRMYCSVQIGANMTKLQAPTLAKTYFLWLQNMSKNIIKVNLEPHLYSISFRFFNKPLLVLELVQQNSCEAIFVVKGGVLAKKQQTGTFAFYCDEKTNLFTIALEYFQPRLPWFVYRRTQAIIHEIVMVKFLRFIKTRY